MPCKLNCASPEYLKGHGTPENIDHFTGHFMVESVFSRSGDIIPLELQRDGKIEMRKILARVMTDNSDTVADLTLGGLG